MLLGYDTFEIYDDDIRIFSVLLLRKGWNFNISLLIFNTCMTRVAMICSGCIANEHMDIVWACFFNYHEKICCGVEDNGGSDRQTELNLSFWTYIPLGHNILRGVDPLSLAIWKFLEVLGRVSD